MPGRITQTVANKVRRYWTDPKFAASFTGAYNFYKALRQQTNDANLKSITYSDVLNILNTIPSYIQQVKKKKGNYERRGLKFEADESGSAFVASAKQSYHGDLGEMPASDAGFRFFLILVDLWNLYTYVQPLKSKEKKAVLLAIKTIIAKNHLGSIDSIGTDKGGEFLGNKDALARMGIRLYTLQGDHKGFYAERRLRDLKHRLYRAARSRFSGNWEIYLQQLADGLNRTPTRALNGLSPASVNSPFSDPVVRQARREAKEGKKLPKKTTLEYKEGDYVYPDLKAITFDDRSFHLQRNTIMVVKAVDRTSKPYLYTVTNLSGAKTLEKKFYAFQLRPAPEPFKDLTSIDRIVEERTVQDGRKKKKQALVQFQQYGPENNIWVDVDKIVGYKGLAWQKKQDELLAKQKEQKKKK